ncbi:hypothetical protein NPIRD3C_0938 [Nitrosopumilus piranensis]|uniref:Uncharacterized protein n=1 Tax=Nitrosopumilus piranensis TaxID=1582439 RepID=A0A0C5BYU6_9ARCH|nr:hypothetical protein NPIRD3C_0938 [Nitrosopumilus piranensis]
MIIGCLSTYSEGLPVTNPHGNVLSSGTIIVVTVFLRLISSLMGVIVVDSEVSAIISDGNIRTAKDAIIARKIPDFVLISEYFPKLLKKFITNLYYGNSSSKSEHAL